MSEEGCKDLVVPTVKVVRPIEIHQKNIQYEPFSCGKTGTVKILAAFDGILA